MIFCTCAVSQVKTAFLAFGQKTVCGKEADTIAPVEKDFFAYCIEIGICVVSNFFEMARRRIYTALAVCISSKKGVGKSKKVLALFLNTDVFFSLVKQ